MSENQHHSLICLCSFFSLYLGLSHCFLPNLTFSSPFKEMASDFHDATYIPLFGNPLLSALLPTPRCPAVISQAHIPFGCLALLILPELSLQADLSFVLSLSFQADAES